MATKKKAPKQANTRTITAFDPASLAKVTFILYGALGLVLGAIFALIAVVSPKGQGGFGLLFAVIAPVAYAVIGAIGAALMALLYNVVADKVGGFQITVK